MTQVVHQRLAGRGLTPSEHAVMVRVVLGRVMRQARSIAVALDYVRALSRDTRANCWDLAEEAGHEGPHRLQGLLS